jgi:hypothetical protein
MFQRVLRLHPGQRNPDPRVGIGLCLAHLGLLELASFSFKQALAAVRSHSIIHVHAHDLHPT